MITETVNGIQLVFETGGAPFAPRALDKGTIAMLSTAKFHHGDKVLDLGCGYGVVGIYAARLIGAGNVMMSDIDARCIELSRKNAALNGVAGVRVIQSDGFRDMREKDFTVILSNPPYHSDFSIAKHFIEKGFNRLAPGGRMLMVTKRRDWYRNKLTAIFGGVRIDEVDEYFVFYAEKRRGRYASAKPG